MAANTLQKDPEMPKKFIDWMNRNVDCTVEQARMAMPELASYSAQSVSQIFNHHKPNAERIWKSGGSSGHSHFRAALAKTRRGGIIDLQTVVDCQDSDDGSLLGKS